MLMVNFTDIHCHMLSKTDDGAVDEYVMLNMLDMAYKSGTRRLCLTPHFNKFLWSDNKQAGEIAFSRLKAYADEKYPDLSLCLGNELFYCESGIDYLNSGQCRTLNGKRYVLVDFHFGTLWYEIKSALLNLVNSGYIPVFAHAERYYCITPPFKNLEELRQFGIIIQINSTSITGGWGKTLQKKSHKILKHRLTDVVASDAHNTLERNPCLDTAASVIIKLCGEEYAGMLLKTNPDKILGVSNN